MANFISISISIFISDVTQSSCVTVELGTRAEVSNTKAQKCKERKERKERKEHRTRKVNVKVKASKE